MILQVGRLVIMDVVVDREKENFVDKVVATDMIFAKNLHCRIMMLKILHHKSV